MQELPLHRFKNAGRNGEHNTAVQVAKMPNYVQSWLHEGDYSNNTARTLEEKRNISNKLLWFVNNRGFVNCGVYELRDFLAYVRSGHTQPGGRWGNPSMVRAVKPATILTYYRYLSSFFTFLVTDQVIDESPFKRIKIPMVRPDQIQPFTHEQLKALIAAAKRSSHPKRSHHFTAFRHRYSCFRTLRFTTVGY